MDAIVFFDTSEGLFNRRVSRDMRWAFTGLLLLVCLSLLAVQATWPDGARQHVRTGVSLSEFQNGIRIDRPQPPVRDAARDRPRTADTRAKPGMAASAAAAAGTGLPPPAARPPAPGGAPADAPVFAITVAQAQAADEPQTGPAARRQAVGGLDNIVAQAETDQAQAPGPQTTGPQTTGPQPLGPPTMAETPQPADPSAPDPAAAAAEPPPRREPAARTQAAVAHPERITIHYRADERSRLVAQRVLLKLASAGLSTAEMHTTVHAIAASTVRYFSPKDAPAAATLARELGTGAGVWRVEDCTAYRHKPEPGTVQLWPATPDRHGK